MDNVNHGFIILLHEAYAFFGDSYEEKGGERVPLKNAIEKLFSFPGSSLFKDPHRQNVIRRNEEAHEKAKDELEAYVREVVDLERALEGYSRAARAREELAPQFGENLDTLKSLFAPDAKTQAFRIPIGDMAPVQWVTPMKYLVKMAGQSIDPTGVDPDYNEMLTRLMISEKVAPALAAAFEYVRTADDR